VLSAVHGWSVSKEDFEEGTSVGIRYVIADARGWPAPALAWRAHAEMPNIGGSFLASGASRRPTFVQMMDRVPMRFLVAGGFVVPPHDSSLGHWALKNAAIPFRIAWPGFAVNTIFYASILWVPIRGPVALRRFLRRRHGLCPACAYPLGESPVCTECGTELRKPAVA
jgi:hypothetical protein